MTKVKKQKGNNTHYNEIVQILARAARRLSAQKLSKSPLTPLAGGSKLRLHGANREEEV